MVLRLEEAEYEREGLVWSSVGVGSHSDAALRLIEDPMGVLSLLEEQVGWRWWGEWWYEEIGRASCRERV